MNLRRLTALAVVGALLAACSGSSPSEAAGNGTITATLEEWHINISPSSVSSGDVTFNITNNGEETHEFVVVSTDLAANNLPVDEAEDKVDESAFTPVDEEEDISRGATPQLVLPDLAPGHYVILCNLTGHYGRGMYADLTVN